MNRNRMLIALAIAILVGLAASVFVYRQMQQVAVTTQPTVVMDRLVVAALPLTLGTRLQPAHISTIPWPANEPISGMFKRPEDVLDRALLTDVTENEPILEAKLAPKEGGAGLPATIPEGMRAVSVAVNDVVAVAGFVTPLTMVDVLVTGSVAGGSGGQALTRTILENIKVLAAGQKIEQDKDGKPQTVPVITLLVTPEQANILTMAATEGRIQLALRNTIDTKKVEPPLVLRSSLFGVPAPPRPAPGPRRAAPRRAEEPPPRYDFVVEVIRGNERKSETFTNP